MNEITDILIFDVGLGQCIFFYPYAHSEYCTLIDCGNTSDFEPIDFIIKKGYIKNELPNLIVTNYDHDHFSGLPYLRSKVYVKSVHFAPNLTSTEIKNFKDEQTEALNHLVYVKDAYTQSMPDFSPPYNKRIFHLHKEHFEGDHDTNNLSQVVFFEQFGTVVCISCDLEEKGWKLLLAAQPDIKNWLRKTNIFIASHHGRKNGYYPALFDYCSPDCIIISDKGIVHETQRNMSSLYGTHIKRAGITFNDTNARKVLTTRDDGHIWIRISPNGSRAYKNFKHK